MASINALSVALFNAAAGGYAAEMAANSAGFANAVGPILEKNISTDALFVEHLLANLGVLPTNSVYEQAKAAVTGLVTAKGRAGAAIDAIDFLKAQEGGTSPYAVIAATFAAKVNQATLFTAANSTERDITKLISGVTGVDTDVAATNVAVAAAVAAQKATDDAAAAKAAADAAAVLKAAQDKAAADLSAANTAAAAAAKAAADAATAAAVKAAADAATAAATLKAAQDAAAAAATAAAEKAELEKAAAVAAVDKTTDNAAAVTTALKAAASAAGVTGYESMTDSQLIAAIKTSNDSAITAAVDKTTDNAAAVTAALKAAALDLGVTGTSAMTDAELITAIKTVNDTAIAAAATAAAEATAATAATKAAADAAAALAAVNDTSYASESAAYTAGQAAGSAGLTYNGVTYASIEAYIAATTPAAPTSSTVTAAQIVTSNAVAGNNAMVINAADAGSYAVTLNTDVVTSDGGFIISGNANLTVTSGAQADTISVVGNGNNSITTGAGSDTVTVVGTGTNTINVGAGSDVVTGGTGNDTITFGSGQLGAGDVVTGGDGTDTVVISGDGNIIGGAGATLTGVENLVLQGTKVTITRAALEGLSSVSGHATTSEVTVDVASGDTLDLSETSITGIKSITADDDVTIVLTAEQIAEIGSITTAAGQNLTIQTSVAGLLALGSKAVAGTGGTKTIQVSDTAANIQANAAAIAAAGATPVLSGTVTVAQAITSLAGASNVTFALSDTAANLAMAPNNVIAAATSLTVTGTATAVQAKQIDAILTAVGNAQLVAGTVTMNVSDTADQIANNYAGSTLDDSVTTVGASNAAQAAVTYAASNNAVYSIVDTAAALAAAAAGNEFDHATAVTASDALTVAQVGTINTASSVDLTSGYSLSDSYNNLTNATSTVIAGAGNITVSGTISVANALTIEALANTGTNRYALSDTIEAVLAASSIVTSSASTVAITSASMTASQANNLLSKFGATKVTGGIVITDTAENLLTLTSASVAECGNNDINVTGTTTVAQALSLNTLAGTKLDKATVDISDTVAAITAGVSSATNVVILDDMHSIAVSDAATVAQITAINTALTAETTGGAGLTAVAGGYTLTDTVANLAAVGASSVVDASGVVNVSNNATVAQITTIAGYYTLTDGDATYGTTLTYSLSDTASNILAAAAGIKSGATSIAITNATVTGEVAAGLVALTKFNGVYTISGDVADLLTNAVTNGVTASIKQNAVSVELRDTVANLQANSSAALAVTDLDTIVIQDTLSNVGGAAAATKSAATSFDLTDTGLTVADAATVNALTKTTAYDVVDAYADFISNGAPVSSAIGTMIANARKVTLSDATTTVAQFNVIDALTAGSIFNNSATTGSTLAISDTIANLGSANAAAAIAAATTKVASDIGSANATVAQAQLLVTYGVDINGLDIVDTSANIAAMSSALLTAIVAANAAGTANDTTITSSDNASLTVSVALANTMFDVTGAAAETDGSSYANYSLSDTAANLAAANANLLNFAQAVTATTAATAAQGATLVARTTMGTPVSYSLSDTATNLAAQTAALNGAVNVTATGAAATIAEARTLNEATNSGSTSYAISDAASTFVDGTPATQALISAAVEAATGTVTASTAATLAEAAVIGGLTKSVTYSISDTAANVANATTAGINEAVNIAITTALTAAQAATFLSATNSGTTTLTAVTDTAANALGLTLGANDVITTLTVTGAVSAVNAAAIAAKDTGANITNTVVFSGTISGSSTEIATIPDAVLAAATTVNVTGAMTVAQFNALASAVTITNVDGYSISDTFANIMADATPATAAVDAQTSTATTRATSVTCTDAINVSQATDFVSNANGSVYQIVDTDANIAASLGTNTIVSNATSVSNGTVTLDIQSIGTGPTVVISGTKAEILALSATLQAENVAFEVSVADLETDSDFYSALGAGKYISVTDTAANLLGGNALLASADHIVVLGAITAAQYTAIAALSATDDLVYSLSDTATNLAALGNAALDAATSATATTSATLLQAQTLQNDASFNIVDTATNVVNLSAHASNATNITLTGSFTAAQATTVVNYTNTGTTTIATVTGTPGDLTTLAGLLNSSTNVTTMTPSAALTVAQAAAITGKGVAFSAYSLSDTAANLASASSSILNGATNIALSGGVATVAQATVIEAATNSGTTTYAIADTAANVLSGAIAVLEGDSDDTIVVTDTSISAATATSLRALDAANNDIVATATITEGFAVNGSATGVFAISDSQANLIATANAAAVAASTAVTVTGNMTVAQAVAVQTATGTVDGSNTLTYNLVDTYTNIVANRSGASALVLTNASVTVSNNLNVAQAKVVDAYTTAATTFNIVDTAANVYASRSHAAVVSSTGASTVTLTTAATVAQAAAITTGAINIVGGYDITDSATNVFAALNTVNSSGGSDRGLLEDADTLTLNTDATVAQALGTGGYATEARGLYKITGLTYSISDTVTNMIAGLAGIDANGILNATSLKASDTTAMSVANAGVLTSLSNFAGYDDAGTVNVVEHNYYIADGFAAIQAADTALIDGATTVAASGTGSADTIDLSMHSKGMTITGGNGVDTITGGSGIDVFAFATADIDTTAGAVTDRIENFASGETIDGSFGAASGAGVLVEAGASVADLATLLTAANTALDGTVKYYVGQITGGDVYIVTDSNGTGYTEVIQLVGVTLASFDGTTSII